MKYSVIEALIKGLDLKSDAPEMAEIARICDFRPKFPPPEISVEKFVALVKWLAQHFYPNLPLSEGLFKMGMLLFEGYRTTIIGRVQLAALNLMGPDRLAKRYPEFAARNRNFGECSVTELGPHHYLVTFRSMPIPPEHSAGLMVAGLKAAGAGEVKISWTQIGPEDTDFDVSW